MLPEMVSEPAVSRNVLVVDDEPAVRDVLRRYLVRRGWQVSEAPSAEDALAMLEDPAKPVDVIIVDLHLPGLSGTALCERISSVRPALASRIVVVSGDINGAAREMQHCRVDCQLLAKPFELTELDRVLASALAA